ncbi:MAG: hypothetical protein Ct9H300mP29_1250 [Candidatus Neomarinimicrobiota bacterium]|nr:MAG: hypothetical protein Ct9H300mP29_1250 [Candidatus Neomarinimicrobiota bacterium]
MLQFNPTQRQKEYRNLILKPLFLIKAFRSTIKFLTVLPDHMKNKVGLITENYLLQIPALIKAPNFILKPTGTKCQCKKHQSDPFLILSIVGVESNYGLHKGEFTVFNALYTQIAKMPRRAKWAKKELIEFLIYCYNDNIPPIQSKDHMQVLLVMGSLFHQVLILTLPMVMVMVFVSPTNGLMFSLVLEII